MSTEMEQLQCLLDSILERKKKMELIGDQVGGWTSKVCQKLATQIGDTNFKDKAMTIEKFRWLSNVVKVQLAEIMAEQKAKAERGAVDSDDESINAKDFINDFATEEFVHKNIRVRPVSSYSTGKHLGDDKSEHNSRHNMLGSSIGDEHDDERKFNADVQHDLNLQRKERKDFLLAQEEKRRMEAEKAEKKKKKI